MVGLTQAFTDMVMGCIVGLLLVSLPLVVTVLLMRIDGLVWRAFWPANNRHPTLVDPPDDGSLL